jgi:hypothetical protein
VAAGISIPAALISWMDGTLPLIQWIAGILAIASALVSIYFAFKRRK